MRNLKRALSLALASVMLLGMMVVGTSAASYPDVDENDNVEAIEVLNAVNVMIGRQGNFEPDEAVNRHEMAVIMAKLVLGVDTADNYVGSHPYTDVVPWADKYVAACYENGLTSGVTATTYGGTQPLTAVQAAAMMLRALGYKDLSKGASDWRAPVTAMANQIRLFNGVASNPSERLNRNQVAQLALNTLKSPIVNLKDNTISWSNDEGQIIMTGGSREYIVLSSREAYARAINDVESAGTSASQIGGWTVELGEHLYNGKLQLRDTTDVFGRPARHWEYDGKVIGDYAKEELLVKDYVGKVTGKDLYDLLTSDVLDDYELIVHVDGVDEPKIVDAVKADPNRNTSIVFDKVDLNRNNKAAVGATGTGVQTEVYVDHIEHEIYVAVINTYLAIADKDYDTKKEETPLTIYGVAQETVSKEYVKLKGDKESYKLGVEEFAITADMAKDDSFLVTLADQEIQTIVPAEVISGATLSAFKLDDHVVSGGTDYNYTTTATYKEGDLNVYTGDGKENLKDRTYDIYLDAYGNLIGLKEIDAKKNYVFISGLDRNGSNLVNRIATANGVFLDGTSETIQINMTKSTWNDVVYTDQNTEGEALLNTWCTYTKNGDIYTVKEVFSAGSSTNLTGAKAATSQFHQTGTTTGREADKEFEINLKNLRLDGGGTAADGFRYVYGDSDSVYLTSELDELRWTDGNGNIAIVTGAETVSTGIIDTSITVWDIKGAADTAEDSKVKGEIPYNANNVAHGVYTLYDKDGIIIAAMAVGEGSAAKDLVYVHSDSLDLESDNGNSSRAAGDGLWTWTRRVIRDGQEVTLTEVGDASEELEFMEQYKWYEVREDGNGDVIKVTRADIALGTTGRDRFVEKYNEINDTVELDNVSTVLYQTVGGPTKVDVKGNYIFDDGFGQTKDETLVVKGNNTLAVNTKEGSGIHFRNDVNVVLQYWNRNTKEIDIMAGEGVDDLKDMVDIVNDITKNTDRYNDGVKKTYYVSALIENGLATDIVIFDSYNTYSVNRPVTPTGEADLEWDKTVEEWTLWVPAGTDVTGLTTSQISNWLLKAGCSEISKTRKGWDFIYEGMSYYEQIVNVKARNTTVTVRTDGNGTATVDDYAAKIGETVTVSYKADAGYELDYIEVNGTKIAGNTFKMAVIPTKVYVAFKATAPVVDEYTLAVNMPANATDKYSVTVNGTAATAGAKVKKTDTIVANPAMAMDIVWNDTAKTVTVQPKEGFVWSTSFGMWIGTDANGNLVTVPFDIAVSMFRMARAVVDPAGTVIDKTDPDWFSKVIRDFGATYTISVGNVVWEGKITAGGTVWIRTAGTVAEAKAAILLIDTATVTKTAAKPVDPTPDADRKAYPVQATVKLDAGKRTVTFQADFEAGKTTRNLTKDEMTAAINREGYVVSNIDLLNNKIKATLNGTEVEITIKTATGTTIKGSVVELDSSAEPALELFQVKYPGKTLYQPAGSVDLEGVTAGVKYLMNKTDLQKKTTDSDVYTVGEYTHKANGVYVAAKDVEFVEGVKVYVAGGTATGTPVTKYTVTDSAGKKATIEMVINVPGVQDKEKFIFTNDLLQKGTVLSLVQSSTATDTDALVDEVFSLVKNNGTPVEYTVAEAGKLPTMADVVVDSVNTANQNPNYKGNFTLDFALGTAPADVYNVTLDGVALTDDPSTPGVYDYTTYVSKDLRKCVIIAETAYGQRIDVSSNITQDSSYNLDGKVKFTFTPASDKALLWNQYGSPADKHTIKLYTAYEVYGPATTSNYGSIYAKKTDALTVANETYAISPDTAIQAGVKKEYVKTNESKDFYLVTEKNVRFVWKDTGSADFAPVDGLGRQLPDNANRVWKITVNKALNKNLVVGTDLVEGLEVTSEAGKIVVTESGGLNTTKTFTLNRSVGVDFSVIAGGKNAGIASIAIQKVDATNGREYLIKVNETNKNMIDVILTKGTAVTTATEIAELRVTLTTGDTIDVLLKVTP